MPDLLVGLPTCALFSVALGFLLGFAPGLLLRFTTRAFFRLPLCLFFHLAARFVGLLPCLFLGFSLDSLFRFTTRNFLRFALGLFLSLSSCFIFHFAARQLFRFAACDFCCFALGLFLDFAARPFLCLAPDFLFSFPLCTRLSVALCLLLGLAANFRFRHFATLILLPKFRLAIRRRLGFRFGIAFGVLLNLAQQIGLSLAAGLHLYFFALPCFGFAFRLGGRFLLGSFLSLPARLRLRHLPCLFVSFPLRLRHKLCLDCRLCRCFLCLAQGVRQTLVPRRRIDLGGWRQKP